MRRTLKTYTDSELLKNYCEDHEADFLVELYCRYLPLVYGVALKYLKNVPDAQDMTMQIWEELPEKVLKHDIQVFKSWLYTCVRNCCLMELRRNTRNLSVELDDKFMEFCDDFNPIEGQQENALQECLESLPLKQRQCVVYFYVNELSYKEIEFKAGFSLKMIKSFIQNGKRNLKFCLERKGIRK